MLLATASCQKENDLVLKGSTPEQSVDPRLIYYKPSTPQEIKLVENLGKITNVLEKLYQERGNTAVVNAAIIAHVYTDESVLLKDLIYPERGLVAANPAFQKFAEKYKLSLADFSGKFLALVREANDPEFTRFIESMNAPTVDRRSKGVNVTTNATGTAGSAASDVTIYYPYTPNRLPPEDYSSDIYGDR